MISTKSDIIDCLNSMPIIKADPSNLKRGWYICMGDGSGCLYLSSDGVITWGVQSFWETKQEAVDFLVEWEAA